MSKFHLHELTGEALAGWDDFVDASPEGTLFHTRAFLEPFPQRHRFFEIRKGDERKAGFVASGCADAPRSMQPVYGAIHNGLFFAPDLVAAESPARHHSTRFAITEHLVESLPSLFDDAILTLAPGIVDVRPFLWFQYHSPQDADHYRVDVRYTSLLALDGIAPTDPADDPLACSTFRELGYSRRQEIRYALRAGVRVERCDADGAVDEFFDAYTAWTRRHDPSIDDHAAALRAACTALAARGRFRVYDAVTSDGRVAARAAFGIDPKQATYLYGMTDADTRESYCGSFVVWEALRDLARSGVPRVDLEGVNSPQRGWFKLSFGGSLTPYYRVRWAGGREAAP